MAAEKDTIYIDVDDEITGIIDKLNDSSGKIVALVLPKRAAVLQSIVNMRLLKRAAEENKKNLVLITSEAGLLPLAGAVGMHVAKTLTTKPEIPIAPTADDGREETVDEADADDETPDFSKEAAATLAVGDLADKAPPLSEDGVETLELDDDEEAAVADLTAADVADEVGKTKKDPVVKKDKKLHVPNFERFRWLLILVLLFLPVIGFGLYYALSVAPKATINIQTDAVNVNANLNLTLDTTAKSVDTDKSIIPAKLVKMDKTYTQQTATTGTKNNGDKATGKVTLSLTDCTTDTVTIPKGTGISSGGLTFITQETASMSSVKVGGVCKNDSFPSVSTDTVAISAQQGGANYNLPAKSAFKVSGYPAVAGSNTEALTGGTDNITKVVSQTDIDTAKAKINTQDTTVNQALVNQLQQSGNSAVKVTFAATNPVISSSANPGEAADSVTVTETVSYSMFGAKSDDFNKLIDNAVGSQIDTSKQSIISEGLNKATFGAISSDDKSAQVTLQTVATAGAALDPATLKSLVAGQKAGYVKQQIGSQPGVTGVDVKLSPFWVSSVPKKQSKITINISKPSSTVKSTNGRH